MRHLDIGIFWTTKYSCIAKGFGISFFTNWDFDNKKGYGVTLYFYKQFNLILKENK